MARLPQRFGWLAVAYLALAGYALVAWLPEIVARYQNLAKTNPRLATLYLTLIAAGGAVLAGLSLWLLFRLWRNTAAKHRAAACGAGKTPRDVGSRTATRTHRQSGNQS